ncbi:hypothetical protein VTN31DRAFT_1376 [Thermomyces dupontii]|uniref:uncharacterized protein n=1 Tax=Talaromyces thermophilus TaxID=28565 RepID=UPI003741F0AC
MKTRSDTTEDNSSPADLNPSRTLILPANASDAARFLVLPNPTTGACNRYFFCPRAGLYELTAVSSPPAQPRSVLLTPSDYGSSQPPQPPKTKGAVTRNAELLVATPFDVMFLLLSILAPAPTTGSGDPAQRKQNLFQPLDDILDSQEDLPPHLRLVLYDTSFRPTLEQRAEAVCDTMEAGDQKLYRFSETKLLRELLGKAERMIAQGLPASLEQRFVRKELEPPLMSVKRGEETAPTIEPVGENGTPSTVESSSSSNSVDSNGSGLSSSSAGGISTPFTPASTVDGSATQPDPTARLLRLRVALSFMLHAYVPPHLAARIRDILASGDSPIDFTPLDERLKQLAELRAQAIRSQSDLFRKRDADDDYGSGTSRKKRRKEEEEGMKKKKASESRGVRELKKVDTTGMKKMSDFFKKKT